MKKFINKLLVSCQLINFFLASMLFIILKLAFFFPIYKNFYTRTNLAEVLKIKPEDLFYYAENLFSYLKYNSALDSSWFSKKDILHMFDVRNLYLVANYSMYFFFLFFLVSSLLLFFSAKKDFLSLIISLFNKIFFFFISILIILALCISLNFNKFWITFHEIFFTNDLWLLSPDESNLIKMFPEEFFFLLVAVIIAIIIFYFLILFIINLIVKKSLKLG